MIKHIAFTVYPVKNMARARKFYEKSLGLKLTTNYRGMWLEYHVLNGAFALTTMIKKAKPVKTGGISFEVKDFDAALKRIKAKRVKVVVPAFDTGGCKNIFIADSEGNTVGLHQKTR